MISWYQLKTALETKGMTDVSRIKELNVWPWGSGTTVAITATVTDDEGCEHSIGGCSSC
jgi:hypothetical protein